MLKLLLIIPMEESFMIELKKLLNYFSDQSVELELLHCFEPEKDKTISIINLSDLIFRERVIKMKNYVDAHNEEFAYRINGKVRLGSVSSLLGSQAYKNTYDAIFLCQNINKKEKLKLKKLDLPLFVRNEDEHSNQLSFHSNKYDKSFSDFYSKSHKFLNLREENWAYILNIP